MKKIIVSLLLLVPLLTGCTNIDTRVTINNDKSASVVSSLTYEGNLADKTDSNAVAIIDNYNSFLDDMYNTENVYGAKLSTVTATKSVKNLMRGDLDLSSLGFKSNLPDGRYIEVKKNFLVTSYNIDMIYNLEKQTQKVKNNSKKVQNSAPKGLQPEYYQKYGDISELEPPVESTREDFLDNLDEDTKQFIENSAQELETSEPVSSDNSMKLSFSIQVPAFASYNNADNVDFNVYTWNIRKDSPTQIKLQYVQYSSWAIAFLILACIAMLIVIARKIYKYDRQKRIDN